ncbi:hypothetical protein FACS1894181_16070 [Bacteroidia bacterium]|nr:hypothetical protein FACS1894181_16070 [Bacteroidia bacterium]
MQESSGSGNVNSFEDTKDGSKTASWKYFYGNESHSNGIVTVIVNVDYDDTIVLQLD